MASHVSHHGRRPRALGPELVCLAGSDLLFMHRLAPADREISFDLVFSDLGVLQDLVPTYGDACNPEAGNCRISPGRGTVCAHTHPRGERVSSADLVVAIQQHPQFGGRRRMSMVVAPLGVYTYAPTPAVLEEWQKAPTALQNRLQLLIKWIGHQLQDETQRGEVERFVEEIRQLGFVVSYTPYKKLTPSDLVVLRLG